MSKKEKLEQIKSVVTVVLDHTECPFREFRDSELSTDFWGLGQAAFRAMQALHMTKSSMKSPMDSIWVDDQTQPLPRSVRSNLQNWVRAEDLAASLWGADVVVYDDNNNSRMVFKDIQFSHANVLQRSAFCRRVLCSCYALEKFDGLTVEHQWDNFTCAFGPEGWEARYHIYSPGLKAGGGVQHKPTLSKNGCYLVRLYYMGAWRCVWVSDQVPVDDTGSPLLPFSPLPTAKTVSPPSAKAGGKGTPAPAIVSKPTTTVHLWPLLICKALLKLGAPDMNCDAENADDEDEPMPEFDIFHALTGGMSINIQSTDYEHLWEVIASEVPKFTWEDETESQSQKNIAKSNKGNKKPSAKDNSTVKRLSMLTVQVKNTKDYPPFYLPGVTPGFEMTLLVLMVRDLPTKKPLPEPEVPLWKTYRWVDWVRAHGLYADYDCPRTRYLRLDALLKMSYALHLLDTKSTETIEVGFRDRESRGKIVETKKKPSTKEAKSANEVRDSTESRKDEKSWVEYTNLLTVINSITIVYFPSMLEFTSAGSAPPVRVTKVPNRALDIVAPKTAPLYLQIDNSEQICMKLSLNVIHPRVLANCRMPVEDYIDPAHVVVEKFEWFEDKELALASGFVRTTRYNSTQIYFQPGRHFFRIWVYSRLNWQLNLLSESTLLLGTRDLILAAASKDCPWVAKFLNNLGQSFLNWAKSNHPTTSTQANREFYKSYEPDLPWDSDVVGYNKALRHWMFRRALESQLKKKLQSFEFKAVCPLLRKIFCDPSFGLPDTPKASKSLRELVDRDPCDCLMPETEEIEEMKEKVVEELDQLAKEKLLVNQATMDRLLMEPESPQTSQVCALASEELPCWVLKEEREKVVKRHVAATKLQSHWRGTWARKCLTQNVVMSADVLQYIMDAAFGSLDSLMGLMNEFFTMFPGAKRAYSVQSGLKGVIGFQQHTGSCPVTTQCKWVPYFEGKFHCHALLKVHFDIQSTIPHGTIEVYDNDTGMKMPQVYNAHITFEFQPNTSGYTVMGHGSLEEPLSINSEAHWTLTIFTSIQDAFHICDNNVAEGCKELPLPTSIKVHVEEIFIPNRRNILGGIQISVTNAETVRFRAVASSSDLKMEAVLYTISNDEREDISKCSGRGEIHWPFIALEPPRGPLSLKMSKSQVILTSVKSKSSKSHSSGKNTTSNSSSNTKLARIPESKQYFIEVIATNGWPLTLGQWRTVDMIRNTIETKPEAVQKKQAVKKDKLNKVSEEKTAPQIKPEPGDAYVVLECSHTTCGGAIVKRDETRDLEFAAERSSWGINEPGRNDRGAKIRDGRRREREEEVGQGEDGHASTNTHSRSLDVEQIHSINNKQLHEGSQPVEVLETEMSLEPEEESMYLMMPDQLRDKFIPLDFVPLCIKDKNEDDWSVLTEDKCIAVNLAREMLMQSALKHMNDLQDYNKQHVLGRQQRRGRLLETLLIDAALSPELLEVMKKRDEAIVQVIQETAMLAIKSKQLAANGSKVPKKK